MMTQSVMTQAANLFGSVAGGVPAKGKQSGSGFDMLIDNSMKAVRASSNSDTVTANKASIQDTESNTNNQNSISAKENDTKDNVKTENIAKSDNANKTDRTEAGQSKSTKSTSNAQETEDVDGDEMAKDQQTLAEIASMLQSIREAVMEVLNLSAEELDQLLADQGMTIADLMQSENLQQLVLANHGVEDILNALTDENLADTLKQLLQTVDGIKADANLGLTDEQVKSFLSKAEELLKARDVAIGNEPDLTGQAVSKEMNTLPEELNSSQVLEDEGNKSVTDVDKSTLTEATKRTDLSENSAGAQSDTGSDSNRDMKAQDQFQVFVDNMVQVSQDVQVNFSGNLEQVTELRNIANQIIERIKVSITPDQTSMELQLNPENLGKVNLSVQSKNGVMTAQFVVQNEVSKEAIESQLHTLRETLNQQGIKVEAIEVTVSSYAFEQNSNEGSGNETGTKKQSSKQISLEEALNMTEIPEGNTVEETVRGDIGNTVDYTA